MAGGCCENDIFDESELERSVWRRALWIALIVNLAMFGVEIGAGVAADSRALFADALDFLGDAANYAISLAVISLALVWRARAALFKSVTIFAFGGWVLIDATIAAFSGATPDAGTMGLVGALALVANVAVAILLFRFRSGDANMRSVWICSRNDAIGNLAVMAAAIGVFGTGSAWPDLAVAGILASLGLVGGWQIIAQSRSELRQEATA